ncbi:MAG: hypothetical protein ACOC1S_03415 [bacterium]
MFDNYNINIKLILLIIIICLGIFLGGSHLYSFYWIEQPVKNEIQALNGVQEIEIDDRNSEIILILDNDLNFPEIILNVKDIVDNRMNDKEYEIKVSGNSNMDLDDFYQDLKFVIYEGIYTHRYSWMKNEVKTIAREYAEGEVNLIIDENYIYLQVINGEEYDYQIYRRINGNFKNREEGGVNSG